VLRVCQVLIAVFILLQKNRQGKYNLIKLPSKLHPCSSAFEIIRGGKFQGRSEHRSAKKFGL
jgi:hypothetical protein